MMTASAWLIVTVLVAIGVPAAVLAHELLAERRRLRRAVFADLDDAAANAAFEPGGYLDGYTPQDIAYDLKMYAADCEHYHETQLLPHVRAWLYHRGLV
jgi:hypothetical protein